MTTAAEFIDVRLSDAVQYGFSGGPQWDTLVRWLKNNRNYRLGQVDFPLHKFTADYSLLEGDAQAEVLSAFWVCRGALSAFRYKDWNDYRARPGNMTGAMAMSAPATSTTPLQITKTYSFGPTDYVRTIWLPNAADLALFFDSGSGPVLFTDYTLDPLTGICTPDTAWPAGTPSWTGTHDVRVRFSQDFNPFTRDKVKTSKCMVELEEDPPLTA